MKNRSLLAYFVLAYAISWAFMVPVALSALIVTGLTTGRAGLRSLLSRLWKWRVDARYCVFAVLVPIALFAVAALGNSLIVFSK